MSQRDEWFEIRVKDPDSQQVIEVARVETPEELGELSQEIAQRARRGDLPSAVKDAGLSVVAEIVHVRQLTRRERKKMAAAGGPDISSDG